MAVLAKNGVWLGAFLTEVDFSKCVTTYDFSVKAVVMLRGIIIGFLFYALFCFMKTRF